MKGPQTDLGYLTIGAGDHVGVLSFSRESSAPAENADFNGFAATDLADIIEAAERLERGQQVPEHLESS